MSHASGPIVITPLEPGTPAFAEATRVRYDALYREWGLPRSLTDDVDRHRYHHIAAWDPERLVGYARIDLDAEECRISQVAVARERRGEGIGALIVSTLLEIAHRAGRTEVFLDSRAHVIPFYERLGFEVVGEEFLSKRTHTPHRRMRRLLESGAPVGGARSPAE